MIRIGIDLSKNKTGITILGDGLLDEIIHHDTLSLTAQDSTWYTQIKTYLKVLATRFDMPNKLCLFVIETSNFGNFKTSLLFNFICGLWVGAINEIFHLFTIIITNSNQHQILSGCLVSDKREVRKLKVKEFFKMNCPKLDWEHWSEDEIDALSLAYWAEHLHSTKEQMEHTKKAKIAKKNEVRAKNTLLKKQNAILTKISKLDKVRNKRQIERLTKELEELK